MRLLIFIEPTSYILPLIREIRARSTVETRAVFLEENFTQAWNLDLDCDGAIQVLKGNHASRLWRLVRLICQPDVQLVYLTGWGHPLLMAALVVAGLRGVPVTMASDTQYNPFTSATRRFLKRILLPSVFRGPKIFFPAGTRQAVYFMHYGVQKSRIRIAQMTVDVRRIMDQVDRLPEPPPSGEAADRPVEFLYVGRLEPHKGIGDLLEAFGTLPWRAGRCRLTIVGDGSLRGFVESAASTYPSINYRGRLTGDALAVAYGRADVFVLPSHVEPWGLVVNEAMAAGLAVIATDRVGCVDDLVHDGKNGCIVPSGSPGLLAQVMHRFVEEPGLAAEMGIKSRDLIAKWTIEDQARILMTGWSLLS